MVIAMITTTGTIVQKLYRVYSLSAHFWLVILRGLVLFGAFR